MEIENDAVALVFNAVERNGEMYVSLDLYTDLQEGDNFEDSLEGYALYEAVRAAKALRFLEDNPMINKAFMDYVARVENNQLDLWTETKGSA